MRYSQKKAMNYYHICTEGTKDRVLFRDNDDYISTMNYIAITCLEHNIILLAFCIMSNHLHFIVLSEYVAAKRFIISVKRRCSLKHWHKYNEHHLFSKDKHPVSIIEINDVDYLKSAIAYVLRNPYKGMGELIWNYPWSSIDAYFNGSMIKPIFKNNLHDNSIRRNTRLLHSNYRIGIPSITIGNHGFIPPKEYVAYQRVESIYATSKAMMYFLNKDNDNEMDIKLTSKRNRMTMSDSKILGMLPSILNANYGVKSLDELDIRQRLAMVGILQRMFNSSPKQIARILQISPQILI